MIEIVLIYLLVGTAAGVLAGLLGVGGGIILVPGLLLVFDLQGIESSVAVHTAIATSMATIVFTAASSARAHHRRGSVDWLLVRRLVPGLVIGAAAGAAIAGLIPGDSLQRIFGVLAGLVAVHLLLAKGEAPKARYALPGAWGMGGAGSGIGALSAIMGIGGGSITVPFLLGGGVPMTRAVGSSSACGLPLAIGGTLSYLLTGLSALDPISGSIGYILLPALACLGVTGMIAAPLGAKLAHQLPAKRLRRIFGGLLLLVSVRLILTA